ncbi:hypothetical protein V6N12_074815 [Hibiscus sabdariffa]|uniref:Uncharacterized protein n=1 Tax=Hibiscus sabdariffa TaxID=183260 RepID=A0ABR2D3A1_9ROSI
MGVTLLGRVACRVGSELDPGPDREPDCPRAFRRTKSVDRKPPSSSSLLSEQFSEKSTRNPRRSVLQKSAPPLSPSPSGVVSASYCI